jgi:hypothetical protein
MDILKIGESDGVLVQVTTLVVFPNQLAGVLMVNETTDPAKAARVKLDSLSLSVQTHSEVSAESLTGRT